MKQIAKEWLKAAEDDILAMKTMLDYDEITNVVAFHAQQCIEKSFKAAIEEFGLGKIKNHQLESLYSKISDHISGFNESIIAPVNSRIKCKEMKDKIKNSGYLRLLLWH